MKRNSLGFIGYVSCTSLLLCLIIYNLFNPVFAQNTNENPDEASRYYDNAENTLRTMEVIRKTIEDSSAYGDRSSLYGVASHYAGQTWNMFEQLVPFKSDWAKYDSSASGWMPGDNMMSQVQNFWLTNPVDREAKFKEKFAEIEAHNPLDAQDWARNMLGFGNMDATYSNGMFFVRPFGFAAILFLLSRLVVPKLKPNSPKPTNKRTAYDVSGNTSAASKNAKIDARVDSACSEAAEILHIQLENFKKIVKTKEKIAKAAVLPVNTFAAGYVFGLMIAGFAVRGVKMELFLIEYTEILRSKLAEFGIELDIQKYVNEDGAIFAYSHEIGGQEYTNKTHNSPYWTGKFEMFERVMELVLLSFRADFLDINLKTLSFEIGTSLLDDSLYKKIKNQIEFCLNNENQKQTQEEKRSPEPADLDSDLDKIIQTLNTAVSTFKRETKISWSVILPAILKVSIKVNILDQGLAATRSFYDEVIDDLRGTQGAIAKGLMGMAVPPSLPEELAKTNIMLWKIVNEMLASGFLATHVVQALSRFALTNAEDKVDEIYAIALLRTAHQELQNENY